MGWSNQDYLVGFMDNWIIKVFDENDIFYSKYDFNLKNGIIILNYFLVVIV